MNRFGAYIFVLALLCGVVAPSMTRAANTPDVEKFCSDPNRKMPATGKQFDGRPADQAVLDLKEGTYPLPGDGSIRIYKDGYFTLTKPRNVLTFFGASRNSGGELLTVGNTMSGCSKEQLSEIMRRNKLDVPGAPGTAAPQEKSLVPGANYLPFVPKPTAEPDAGK
jgi:hypothetical protein